MPSKKHGKTWKAEPHTLAKIEMLKAYLHAYFPILGTSKRGQPFLYVDGFAGPGEYTNSPTGSPLAALAAATGAMSQLGPRWTAGVVTCVFIEPDPARCEHLRQRIAPFAREARLATKVIRDSFVGGMTQLRRDMPRPFVSDDPLFVFIDPFGATGVPFNVVADILRSPCSEVLINLDADGIARIFKAEDNPNREVHLTTVFGDESWRSALKPEEPFSMLCRRVLDLYKSKLRSLNGVRYVFAFEMQGVTKTLNYYLVFASHHPKGQRKMKESMMMIDRSGSYCFSDGGIGQDVLFRFDDPEQFASELHRAFVGREVTYRELYDFALNETPFINPKGMLKAVEAKNLLTVKSLNPKRRRGDFDEKTLISVTFLPEEPKATEGSLFDGYGE